VIRANLIPLIAPLLGTAILLYTGRSDLPS